MIYVISTALNFFLGALCMRLWFEIKSLRNYCESKDYINAQLFEQYRKNKVLITESVARDIVWGVASLLVPNPEDYIEGATKVVLYKLKYSDIVDMRNTDNII